jgi:hypothetical protein
LACIHETDLLVFNMRRMKQEVEPTNLGLCVPSKNLVEQPLQQNEQIHGYY